MKSTGTLIGGLIFLALGIGFTLEAMDVWTIRLADLRLVGPLMLVVIGVVVLLGTIDLSKTSN